MRTIDLFCGCGGMSLGFQNAGFEIAAAFDNWSAAVNIYRQNFQHPVFLQDLRAASRQELQQFQPEIIIGGPPCQDFSSAGKRSENEKADLTLTFAELVTGAKPGWFVMENVDRIEKSAVLHKAKDLFWQAGYGLSEVILNASLCGVPQSRKRYFLVGNMEGKDDALLPYFSKNQASRPMTIFDFLGNSLGIEYYYRHPRSYARRAIFSIHEPGATVRGVNRPVPKTYQPHPGDAAPVTSELRPLTTRERSYLQTFPPEFIFEGAKTDQEQMIGNAVPVKLAEFVARCILAYRHDKQHGLINESPQQPEQLRLF